MAMKAAVYIETKIKAGKTVLHKAYCTPPFKVMNITEDQREKVLRLMLMSSSPGILDGDDYDIRINLFHDSALDLQTQSYQRLFSMIKGAKQQLSVQLEAGASFKFLPHPVVPHEAADFFSHNKIFLSSNCTLIWGEVLTCGRKLNDEIFRFTRYHAITEIFLNSKLVIKENIFMQPGKIKVSGIGQLEDYTHQATLIFLDEKIVVKEIIGLLAESLDADEKIIYGITAAPVNGIILRLLGNKAELLHHCVRTVAEMIQSLILKNSLY